jgi:adenylate cyclase
MALEIERKFLVLNDDWRATVERATPIRQGYFCRTPLMCARIRVLGDQGFITIKSEHGSLVRHEFEYEIPKPDAIEMINRFCIEPIIAKTRHSVTYHGNLWTIDVFEGANTGLVVAEVELTDAAQSVALPPWAGADVTSDKRYGNANLASNPFTTWNDAA